MQISFEGPEAHEVLAAGDFNGWIAQFIEGAESYLQPNARHLAVRRGAARTKTQRQADD